jgi:N-glycosylase/DNA lyase
MSLLSHKASRASSTLKLRVHGPLDLESTLECGQAFRWSKVSGPDGVMWYKGVIGCSGVMVRFDSNSSNLFILYEVESASARDTASEIRDRLANAVYLYFALDDDLDAIRAFLANEGLAEEGIVDQVINSAASHGRGLRILRQDPWECLVSYIVSTNKNIPAIRKTVDYFCRALGSPAGLGEYTFPSAEAFLGAGPYCIKDSKCGYRASYILDAAAKVAEKQVNLNALWSLPVGEARQELMKIKGVGPKVADCVLLFAYHRLEVFPVDVWIARAMSHFYFGGREMTAKEAREEGSRRFGPFAGYAQEYLFHYARNVLDGNVKCQS